MKDSNYIVIQGWMYELGLTKLNEIIALALVYGFSQDGESIFRGSLNYIAEYLMCDKRTAMRVMSVLEEKDLVIKEQKDINGVKFNRYRINDGVVKKCHRGCQNFTGGDKMSPNNTSNNKYSISTSTTTIDNIYTINNISKEEKMITVWLVEDEEIRKMQFHRLGLLDGQADFLTVLQEKVSQFYEQCRLDGKGDITSRGRMDVISHFNNWIKRTTQKQVEDVKQDSISTAMQQLMAGLES